MESNLDPQRPVPRSPPNARLKILYIQPGTSSFAGIERVVHTICSQLAEKHGDDFDIDVLYTARNTHRPDDRKYNTIDRIARGRIPVMRAYRSVIKDKPYSLIVVPQIERTVICMTACLGLRRNFAMHLHGNPKRERNHFKSKILFLIMRMFFLSRVSSVFGTSRKQLEAFKMMFDSSTPQSWVPNPVRTFDGANRQSSGESGHVTFVNVGRFSFQKGQDILLNAFNELRKTRGNVKLRLVGYGADEASLQDDIRRLQIENLVSIEHHPDDPQPALSSSDVYISTSRWEGWSLAICEALRFGLPVISTDCEFGPSEILVDPRLGRLVPSCDLAELTKAMIYYCDNLQDEQSHADFRRNFIDQYSPERVVEIHAEALRAAAKQDHVSKTERA
ncbi:glycosyltransferase family 4 protein [Rhizobium grahamii]|uniref:Glycosyltransferase family 4 protein n=1 Tax=Rhizobium grahamii TaxID=1120045 RepID=A0A5Q0C274_9HYPH|nr:MULTISPECIES: glycosyltransferase [Rhizobium]QFY59988.1 glycosyltransferase family 4 protein [Rhizobium grahamii]QRM50893.1 glycosyltransferase family 4 protein [Rhizobium sp. BG6]